MVCIVVYIATIPGSRPDQQQNKFDAGGSYINFILLKYKLDAGVSYINKVQN